MGFAWGLIADKVITMPTESLSRTTIEDGGFVVSTHFSETRLEFSSHSRALALQLSMTRVEPVKYATGDLQSTISHW